MKGLEKILYAAYGNHPQSAKHKGKGEEILLALRAAHNIERSELMEAIGLDPDDDNDDRRFQRIIAPWGQRI